MSAVSRFGPYPLMTEGTLDYKEGNSYITNKVGGSREGLEINVEHCVTGNNLVTEFLSDGRAVFACTVTAPQCAYRKIFVSEEPLKKINGSVVQQQKIACDEDKVGHPVVFQPHIVYRGEPDLFIAEARHGLDEFWIGESFEIPSAAILAAGPFWTPLDEVRSILRLQKDVHKRLPAGCFTVDDSAEEGFYFRVLVSPDLYESLRNPGGAWRHRDSIYAAAFAQGLEILRVKYCDAEEWKGHFNLCRLYKKFQEKDVRTWDDQNFNANKAVAAFHPHKMFTDSDEMEDS